MKGVRHIAFVIALLAAVIGMAKDDKIEELFKGKDLSASWKLESGLKQIDDVCVVGFKM